MLLHPLWLSASISGEVIEALYAPFFVDIIVPAQAVDLVPAEEPNKWV